MNVAFFSTCLASMLDQEIEVSCLKLLKHAGCKVSVPKQGCCGQANYNAGDIGGAKELAYYFLAQFENTDYVVVPSGSCAAQLKLQAPALFDDDSKTQARMQRLASKVYELSQFLDKIVAPQFKSNMTESVAYHDSCTGLRSLGIKSQPRKLLGKASISITEAENAETCCGFGGTFCVKQPEISCRMADDKIDGVSRDVKLLLGGDLGCLIHLQSRIDKLGKNITAQHFSVILATHIKGE